MDALQSMEQYLSTRPTRFPSISSGIEWQYVNSNPSLFRNKNRMSNTRTSTRSRTIRNRTSARISVPSLLHEESNPSDPTRPWVWRTNLAATKPFWENWFIGLSRKFLEARGGKLLILAGTDRLDKELMIGQMQGEFFPPPFFFLSFNSMAQYVQVIANIIQENISSKSSPKQATSYKKIYPRKQLRS